jgi:hypothetical protein
MSDTTPKPPPPLPPGPVDERGQPVARDRRNADGRDRRCALRPRPINNGRRATDPAPDWVSVTEYARRHSVDRGTVYKWLRHGLLDHYQVEAVLRIRNVPPRKTPRPSAVDRCGPASIL